MKKGLLFGGAVLIVVIVAGVVILFTGLGGVVKAAVEKAGSDVTQVKVTLDNAEVTPTEGRAALHGLIVGNPTGFQSDNAFRMGTISVTLDTATVTQDPIVIKEVVIADPVMTYELGTGGSNFDAIMKNIERYGGGGQKADADGPKVVIENLYVRGGMVNVSAVPLGGKSMTASLPEIHLQDIGKDTGGADYGEVAEKVMAVLINQTGSFVAGLDLGGVLEGVTDMPDALKGLAGGTAGQAGEAAKGAGEKAGEAVKKLLGN